MNEPDVRVVERFPWGAIVWSGPNRNHLDLFQVVVSNPETDDVRPAIVAAKCIAHRMAG